MEKSKKYDIPMNNFFDYIDYVYEKSTGRDPTGRKMMKW